MASETTKSKKDFQSWGFLKHLELYEAAYFDPRLQPATVLLLGLIIRHTKPDGISRHFSIMGTAKRKNVSRQAIQNQVKKLAKHGYIKIKTSKGFKSQYTLLFDNLDRGHATQYGCTPEHATQLDCAPATSRGCDHATTLDCVNKMEENTNIKKEKNAQVRGDFLDLVKEAITTHSFQDTGNLSEEILLTQAAACWEAWDGSGEFPKGNPISKFKGWIRKGLREGSIKEAIDISTDSNARQGVKEVNYTNPLQDWHKKIEPLVGEKVFKSWFRECWHDGNGKLCAPNEFKAKWIRDNYKEQIAQVLPDTSIIEQPYKETEENHEIKN